MAKQEVQKPAAKRNTFKSKKKVARNVPSGIVFVKASFNNTIVSITDLSGNVI